MGADDDTVLDALARACEAVVEFGSELVVVSLGVDTHERDPISDLAVTTEGFARQGAAIAALDLPVVIVQEGGYDIDTIGANVVAFVSQHPW
jgi:acetoin utilization deacetylase AcuC-like enzyme